MRNEHYITINLDNLFYKAVSSDPEAMISFVADYCAKKVLSDYPEEEELRHFLKVCFSNGIRQCINDCSYRIHCSQLNEPSKRSYSSRKARFGFVERNK
ncbi:MAG: hypothetical protein MJZ16_07730 [Bacteroidales bacterium]|nr:hypothetical protein [Bacteroidales bacterium]